VLQLPPPYDAPVFWDSEFQHKDGEAGQRPVCLCAEDSLTGQRIELFEDELYKLRKLPFGDKRIWVSFGSFAETATVDELKIPRPHHQLDLYPESRRQTNDAPHKSGSLLSAMEHFGLPHMSVQDKDANRKLIMDQNSWTESQKRRIKGYCWADVDALKLLLPALLPGMECIDHAVAHSEYMCTMADIYRAGIPMDVPTLRLMQDSWDLIRANMIASVNEVYGTYVDGKWNTDAFDDYLNRNHIDIWPASEKTGRLILDQDVFKDMSRIFPQLNLLREARASLGKVRPIDLDIGEDGRCRSHLYPFATITGRNAPRKFPFAPATWTRSLIKPPRGRAIAYCDWSGQELAIAASFSGDTNMMRDYATGDFYLAMAKAFGIAPPEATKATHAAIREVAKVLCLGLNYGMTAYGLAHRLNIGYAEAEDLVAKHRRTYPEFWAYSDAVLDSAMLDGQLMSVFGWSYQVTGATNPRSLRNWHMQAAGGDMLRLAVIAMHAAGITVIAPVHDAVLIEADEARIDEHVACAKELMVKASSVVTNGFPLRVDTKIFAGGQRYFDRRGAAMWNGVARMLNHG
jgi:DNA polymerase-1